MATRTGICLSCGYFNENTGCRKCKSNNICWIDSTEWEERKLEYLELIKINKDKFKSLSVRAKELTHSILGSPYVFINPISQIFKYCIQELK